ncbi:hypothetical protein CSUI_002833 [Cystoisospora suis]|uniref:Uncharacterized protein n=1 Tax=Cystoisospora suis TaxID=483139 RepID=A0A2C6L7R7_9APIC|nr:hypothetical protein CSUI_002833 [Cystoisospora suis]
MKAATFSSQGEDQAGEIRTDSSTSPVTRKEDASIRVEEKVSNHPVVLFLILSPELSTHVGHDRRKEETGEGSSSSGSVPGKARANKADDKEREDIAHQPPREEEEEIDRPLREDHTSDKTRRGLCSDVSKDESVSSIISRGGLPSASPLNSFLTTLSSKLDYFSSKDMHDVKERTPPSYDTVYVRTKYYDAPIQFVFHSLEPSTAHPSSLSFSSSSPPSSSPMDFSSSCLLDSHPEALIIVYSRQGTTPVSPISSSSCFTGNTLPSSSSSLLQETVAQSETSSTSYCSSELSSHQTYLSNSFEVERKYSQKPDAFSSFSRLFLSNSKSHTMQRKEDTDRSLLPLPEALRRCPYTLRSDCVEEKRGKKEKGQRQSGEREEAASHSSIQRTHSEEEEEEEEEIYRMKEDAIKAGYSPLQDEDGEEEKDEERQVEEEQEEEMNGEWLKSIPIKFLVGFDLLSSSSLYQTEDRKGERHEERGETSKMKKEGAFFLSSCRERWGGIEEEDEEEEGDYADPSEILIFENNSIFEHISLPLFLPLSHPCHPRDSQRGEGEKEKEERNKAKKNACTLTMTESGSNPSSKMSFSFVDNASPHVPLSSSSSLSPSSCSSPSSSLFTPLPPSSSSFSPSSTSTTTDGCASSTSTDGYFSFSQSSLPASCTSSVHTHPGMERLVEALHCHAWPNLKRRSESSSLAKSRKERLYCHQMNEQAKKREEDISGNHGFERACLSTLEGYNTPSHVSLPVFCDLSSASHPVCINSSSVHVEGEAAPKRESIHDCEVIESEERLKRNERGKGTMTKNDDRGVLSEKKEGEKLRDGQGEEEDREIFLSEHEEVEQKKKKRVEEGGVGEGEENKRGEKTGELRAEDERIEKEKREGTCMLTSEKKTCKDVNKIGVNSRGEDDEDKKKTKEDDHHSRMKDSNDRMKQDVEAKISSTSQSNDNEEKNKKKKERMEPTAESIQDFAYLIHKIKETRDQSAGLSFEERRTRAEAVAMQLMGMLGLSESEEDESD